MKQSSPSKTCFIFNFPSKIIKQILSLIVYFSVGLHSIVIYGTEPVTEATPTVATADLTLCIGLGLAFVIFLVVIFVIIKILRRKGGPYPNYGLGPEGKILFSSDSNLSEYLYVCRYMYVCICFMCRYLPRYFLLVSVGIHV